MGGPDDSLATAASLAQGNEHAGHRPGEYVDALAVNDTVFVDWILSPGSSNWVKGQSTNVPIEFGSSG